ncbi:MAG: GNAT family N-acetyltransferase [Acetobacteraceae bacterium]|nr:GNAT family N-acetyltransferase [Acetobacteraceae bacterium]
MALLHAAAFPPIDRWSATAFATQLALPGVFGLIDERGGLALARVIADEAELLTIAVHPAARRQGIGRTLLTAVLSEAARRGAVTVFLEVAESNAPAHALYASLAFTPVGRRKGYYASADALVLRRVMTALS